jgi:hypothetical protein
MLEFAIYKSRGKEMKKMIELTLSQVFLGLDESKKAEKLTLDLSWVVLTTWMRAR